MTTLTTLKLLAVGLFGVAAALSLPLWALPCVLYAEVQLGRMLLGVNMDDDEDDD